MADVGATDQIIWSARLGAHLEAFRKHANLRRIDLAYKMGVSEETIRLWEKGTVQPSAERLPRLIALLSLETADWPLREGPHDDLPPLAAALWTEREARSITQAAAAHALGVAHGTYAGWETGRSTPSDGFVPGVAAFLGLDLDEAATLCATPFTVDTTGWPAFGQLLGKRREALRLTRSGLAAAVGVSQHAVVAWELGSRAPGPQQLPRLAEALGVESSLLVAALPSRGVASALGQLILTRQRELGLRSADVARLAGTTEATVSRWVNGHSRPVPANLRRLAEALKVPYPMVVDAVGAA
jgi:transcriptional regulator with XRE-family HTH domain